MKGKGVSFMEHPVALADGGGTYRWHAGAPGDEPFARAVAELEARLAERCAAVGLDPPALEPVEPEAPVGGLEGEPESGAGARATPRVTEEYVVEAYGEALLELGAERGDLVVLDADLASDCRTRAFELAYPDRFVQCGIAEQDMVSTAAGMARHGLLPVVNSFASFLASRANEQIYNQASEGSKVVYALHYAGLIPAGPGKSHQSVRDISLLAALPNVTIVQPGSWDETRGLLRWAVEDADESVALRLAIGPSPRRLELPARGVGDRAGQRAARRRRRRAALVRAGDAPRGAPGRRGAGGERGAVGSCRGDAVAQPLRRGLAQRRGRPLRPRLRPRGPRAGGRPRRRPPGRAPGPCRDGLRRRRLARVRHARRGAPVPRPRWRVARSADRRARRPPSRQSQLARRSMTKRTWVVLPDQLSIRVFFDTGIVGGLRERLDGHLAAVFLVPREAAAEWVDRVPGLPVLDGDALTAADGLPDRALARVDASLDRRLGYHPLAIRLNDRHGFHAERMQAGHPNWMLDTDRDGPLPHWPAIDRAWSDGSSARDGTSRAGFSRRCGASAPASCSRTCSPRARCRSSRRRVGCGCRWSRTSPAGTTRSGRASSRRTATSTSCRTA